MKTYASSSDLGTGTSGTGLQSLRGQVMVLGL